VRRPIRLAALIILAAAISSCSMFDYSGMVVNKFALVYGVSRYTTATPPAPDPARGPNLQFPDADASSMAALLEAEGYTITEAAGSGWNLSEGEV